MDAVEGCPPAREAAFGTRALASGFPLFFYLLNCYYIMLALGFRPIDITKNYKKKIYNMLVGYNICI